MAEGVLREKEKAKVTFSAPLFGTYAVMDDTHKDPETGACMPSEENVIAAKRWVEENEL